MNEQLARELNENLKRLLEPKKKVKPTDEEIIAEFSRQTKLKYYKKFSNK